MKKVGIFSLRWKTVFLYVLLSVLILSVYSYLNYFRAYEIHKEKLICEINLNVEKSVNEINTWFSSRITALETLAVSLSTPGAVERLLDAGEDFNPYLAPFNGFTGLNPYIGLAGHPPYYGGDFPQPDGYIVEDRPWYTAAVSARDTTFTDYYIDSETKSLTTTLVTMLHTENDLDVVIATDLRLKELMNKLYSADFHGASVMMVDENGTILAHENKEYINTSGNSDDFNKMVNTMCNQKNGVIENERGGTEYITVIKEIDSTGWILGYQIEDEILFSSLSKLKKSYIFLTVLSMLIFAGFSIVIAEGINRKIVYFSNRLSEIAEGEGDLSISVGVNGRDELALLADSFNRFLEKLSGLVSGIKDISTEITICKNRLEDNTNDTTFSADEINSSLSLIGTEMSNLNLSIERNAAASDEINIQIQNLDKKMIDQLVLVEQTTSAITEIMASIKNIVIICENRKITADELNSNTEEGNRQLYDTQKIFNEGVVKRLYSIRDITQVIKGIAGQINILSMNAAIEAAHAGDAGRGFAVVAEEIRKLAETSADSVSNIETVIKQINDAVSETSSSVKNTAVTFNEISNSVENFTSAFTEITNSTVELFEGGNQILTSASELHEISMGIKSGAAEMSTQIQTVSKENYSISSFSTAVFNSIDRVASKSESIVEISGTSKEIIESLIQNTEKMNKELGRFKTR